MLITLDITDRELLDLDTAVTNRRLSLQVEQRKLNAAITDAVKESNLKKLKEYQLESRLIADEITSINTVMDRLYDAVTVAVGTINNLT